MINMRDDGKITEIRACGHRLTLCPGGRNSRIHEMCVVLTRDVQYFDCLNEMTRACGRHRFAETWHPQGVLRSVGRIILGALLCGAGIGHFANAGAFLAQVPPWMPAPEAVVSISGVVELILGTALLVSPQRYRYAISWTVAAFFVLIFPGNISQFIAGTDAFGLDSDASRFVRLFFQPVLVVWALWCTSAWSQWRTRRKKVSS